MLLQPNLDVNFHNDYLITCHNYTCNASKNFSSLQEFNKIFVLVLLYIC
jgi:hypothetical protein